VIWSDLAAQVWQRLLDSLKVAPPDLDDRLIWVIVAAGVVVLSPLWKWVRPTVTVIHELGHALVGVVCGRRFRGFVISPDMSGHAITKGPARGPGMVLTLAAGYPMPGLVGAVLIWAAVSGRADLVLLVAIVALCIGLVMSRSLYTAGTMVAMLTIAVVLWWRAAATWNAAVVCGLGVVVLLGAWRHLVAVAGSRAPRQDPGALARLTGIPAAIWTLMFALILGACSWWAGRVIVAGLG
jgi:hypothetical protein